MRSIEKPTVCSQKNSRRSQTGNLDSIDSRTTTKESQWISTRYLQVDLSSKEDYKDKVNKDDRDNVYLPKKTNDERTIIFVSFVGNQDTTPLNVVLKIRTDSLNNRDSRNKV